MPSFTTKDGTPGGSHALGDTHREQVNRDLLAFLWS